LEEIESKITDIANNTPLYNQLSKAAFKKAKQFSLDNMINGAIQSI